MCIRDSLEIIPVINKIDLQSARPDEVAEELGLVLGTDKNKMLHISAKTGAGVEEILERIIVDIPPPTGDEGKPLQALIFDSEYDSYRGIVVLSLIHI